MTAIRILQSLATLDRGGAESMIMSLYRNIDRDKFQFDFVVNAQETPYAFEEEVKALGGRVFKTPKFNGKNMYAYRKAMQQMFISVPEWPIVHIHNTSSAMLFMDIARKHSLKTIAHAHFDNDLNDFRSSVQRIIRRPIKYKADYLMACSKLAGSYGFRIKEEDVHVLNNAIETEAYVFNEEVRELKRVALGIQEKTVLGHVGRMDEEKNHLYLIDIFQKYHKLNPESVLLLVGTGRLREIIEQKVQAYGLKQSVYFLGVRADVNELLQAMDIFVFPSKFEGLPVTLVEAQAAGLPIMASDRITKDIVLTDDLITFKSIDRNPYYWAKRIDEQLILFRNDMTEAIKSAGYDVKETAHDLEKYYQSILEDVD